MIVRSVVVFAVVIHGSYAFAQQAPVAGIHVTGLVSDADAQTETPLRHARVVASETSTRVSPAFTDDKGVFSLDLPGEATLTVAKAGWVQQTVKVTRPRGTAELRLDVPLKRGAAITGRVLDEFGAPAPNATAIVRAVSPTETESNRRRTVQTDDRGEFRFGGLGEGEFTISVEALAVAAAAPVSVRVRPGDSVDVGALMFRPGTPSGGPAPPPSEKVLTNWRSLTGHVRDEYGDPVEGARIRVLQIRHAGERIAAMAPPDLKPRTSDDLGEYRLFGLAPGRYLVVADDDTLGLLMDDQSSPVGYAPIFYPGVANVTFALPVPLDQGEASGIDIAFHREPTARVSGMVLDSAGRPVTGGVLLGVSQRSGAMLLEPRTARAAADGTYAFENVPEGDYVLQAITPAGGLPRPEPGKPVRLPPMEFGMQYVTITGAGPREVTLRTSAGALLRGRITVEPQAATRPSSLTVWPFPTDFDASFSIGMGPAGLTQKNDDTFEITGVTGPRRFTMTSVIDGWYLKAASVRGVDALDVPFDFGLDVREFDDIEVVVSPAAATISGKISGPGCDPPNGCAALVFSGDPSKWYRRSQSLRLERLAQNGEFRAAGLPPGSYYVLALSDRSDLVTIGSWQDPENLEKLRARATPVTVHEAESRVVTLRLASGR
jgi:protocatechuate 3,4-dioxygenase beta subunit